MSKHNDLFHIPSGHFISLVNFFLLLVLKETAALKELLPSHKCAAERENVVNKKVFIFSTLAAASHDLTGLAEQAQHL